LDAAERLARQQQDAEQAQAAVLLTAGTSHMPVLQLPSTIVDSVVKVELKSVDSMPCLIPEDAAVAEDQLIDEPKQEFGSDNAMGKGWLCSANEEDEDIRDWVSMKNRPFNMRVVNLNNFPITQTLYRTNYRSHSTACVRAKMGSIQNTAKSLDLMRNLLQKSINKEIDVIIQKYIEEFFRPAIENIRLNNGENSVSDEHMQTVCRQILEEAKKMYSSDIRSATPFDVSVDSMSDAGSVVEGRPSRHAQLYAVRKRRLSSGSESSSHTAKLKRKGRVMPHLQSGSGRSTPSRTIKSEPIRREGPQWNPDRLKPDTQFVMGSKANKALGLGATRGRLYIKHPDIFKYGGDQDDKQWLHEKQYMPATGGRTYLLLVDDIRDLAQTDEYRNSGALQLDELVGFTVPDWMLDKMKCQMRLMRTDYTRPSKLPLDSTPVISSQEASPANTNPPSPEQDDDAEEEKSIAMSPLNETGGFSREDLSPPGSQDVAGEGGDGTNLDVYDDNTALTGSFYVD
jgi:deoxynucleotidyltransferase terminal-interacting protein 1